METILLIVGLVMVVLLWSHISKALNWFGIRVAHSTNMIEDIIDAGAKQTARGVVLSHDTLLDTIYESSKRSLVRAEDIAESRKDITDEAKAVLDEHDKWSNKYISR